MFKCVCLYIFFSSLLISLTEYSIVIVFRLFSVFVALMPNQMMPLHTKWVWQIKVSVLWGFNLDCWELRMVLWWSKKNIGSPFFCSGSSCNLPGLVHHFTFIHKCNFVDINPTDNIDLINLSDILFFFGIEWWCRMGLIDSLVCWRDFPSRCIELVCVCSPSTDLIDFDQSLRH